MRQITQNVYYENRFHGCNTGFIVTKEGVVVIDTPMVPKEARQWRDEARKFGPILYVIDTEPHQDHMAGNKYFEGAVIGHEGTRRAIMMASPSHLQRFLERLAPDALPLDDDFTFRVPDITFSQNMSLHLGEHTLHLINMPGHTPYQAAVYLPDERVVFTSDTVHKGMTFMSGSQPYAWLESLRRLEELDVDFLVPGHGRVSDRSMVSEMRTHIQDWINAVSDALARGLNLDEAQNTINLLDSYPGKLTEEKKRIHIMNINYLYRALQQR